MRSGKHRVLSNGEKKDGRADTETDRETNRQMGGERDGMIRRNRVAQRERGGGREERKRERESWQKRNIEKKS